MTHTPQSEQNSTSEFEYWFKKTNYMSKYLNPASKEIIKKLKETKSYG